MLFLQRDGILFRLTIFATMVNTCASAVCTMNSDSKEKGFIIARTWPSLIRTSMLFSLVLYKHETQLTTFYV